MNAEYTNESGAKIELKRASLVQGAEAANVCSSGSAQHIPRHVQGSPSASTPGYRQVVDF